MKKIITILFCLTLLFGTQIPITKAQSSPCTGTGPYQQTCTSNYQGCIQSGASASSCNQWAAQYNASMLDFYNVNHCDTNPNQPICNTDLQAASNASNQINSITQDALVVRQAGSLGGTGSPQNCGTNCNLSYIPLEPLPGEPIVNGNYQADLPTYIKQGFNILVVLGGFLAVILIVWGGITYMSSEVSASNKARAKERIRNAVLGLLLLLGSWLILHTINPQLTQFNTIFNPTTGLAGSTAPTRGSAATGGPSGSAGAPGTAEAVQCQSSGCYESNQSGQWTCVCPQTTTAY